MAESLTIATRGSKLALWQAEHVKALLSQTRADLDIKLNIITTKGDQILDTALNKIGDKGLFTAELEASLLEGTSDIAVHSFKDLESTLSDDFAIHAVLERSDPRDALLIRKDKAVKGDAPLSQLSQAAVLGTGSLRRAAMARALRPDLDIHDLRGNVDTRLKKLVKGDYDGIILAVAGLKRLGFIGGDDLLASAELDTHGIAIVPLDLITWIPAPSQGVIAIEGRAGDERIASLLAPINHEKTGTCAFAERAFLSTLGGGCQIPAGAYACYSAEAPGESAIKIRGAIFSTDGKDSFTGIEPATKNNATSMGAALAQRLLDQGAKTIIDQLSKDVS